jgi:hypothetical protein
MPNFIAWIIIPVLDKLHTRAFKRAAVSTHHEPFDKLSSDQFQLGKLSQLDGIFRKRSIRHDRIRR